MKSLLILPLSLLLSACVGGPQTEFIETTIPAALLAPCPPPDRDVETVEDVNLLIVDLHAALDKCDGQIKAIKRIQKTKT